MRRSTMLLFLLVAAGGCKESAGDPACHASPAPSECCANLYYPDPGGCNECECWCGDGDCGWSCTTIGCDVAELDSGSDVKNDTPATPGQDTGQNEWTALPDSRETVLTPCDGDQACARGRVCLEGVCVVQVCQGTADCHMGQTCVDVNDDGMKECNRVECLSDADCLSVDPAGTDWCVMGVCLPRSNEPVDVTAPDAGGEVVPPVEGTDN